MNDKLIYLKQKLPDLEINLLKDWAETCQIIDVRDKTPILSAGAYVKILPVVLSGAVKVYSNYEDKEFLLYYIKPSQSCIMSFSACLSDSKSKVAAHTVSDSQILMLPSEKIRKWISEFQSFNNLFYNLFEERYTDMINTLNSVLFENIEDRILRYLYQMRRLNETSELNIKHREIAEDIGTAREVVSRILKKLEKDKRIVQVKGTIKIL